MTSPNRGSENRPLGLRKPVVRVSAAMASAIAVVGALGVILALAGGEDSPAEAQPIPCEQWQQMHPGWPCADVPTFSPQPTQPPNTGAPAPPPTLLSPPSVQGGPGGGAGALTPPPLQAPPNMNNPIVPVPGYTPPVLPGNEPPAAPQAPGAGPAQSGANPSDSLEPAPPAVPPSGSDLVAQLQALAQLHVDGALSDQEFALAKQRLLNAQVPSTITPAPPQPGSDTEQSPPSSVTNQGEDSDPRIAVLALVGVIAFSAGAARASRAGLVRPADHPLPEPDQPGDGEHGPHGEVEPMPNIGVGPGQPLRPPPVELPGTGRGEPAPEDPTKSDPQRPENSDDALSEAEVTRIQRLANSEADLLDTGYTLDEIAQMAYQHTGEGEVFEDRPTAKQIEDTLRNDHNPQRLRNSDGKWQNSWKYRWNGTTVIVNRDTPWKSTSY